MVKSLLVRNPNKCFVWMMLYVDILVKK